MANNINKELDTTASKIKALHVALTGIKNAFNDMSDEFDTSELAGFNAMVIRSKKELDSLEEEIKSLKVMSGAVSAGTQQFDLMKERISDTKKRFDGLINTYSNMGKMTNVIMPSSFSEDSNIQKIKQEQSAIMTASQIKENISKANIERAQKEAQAMARALEEEEKQTRETMDEETRVSKLAQEKKIQYLNKLKDAVSRVYKAISSTIKTIVNVIRTGFNTMNKSIQITVSVFSTFKSAVQRVISLLGNFGNRIRQNTSNTNIMKGSITELRSALSLLSGAMNKVFNNNFISNGMKLLSSIQTLNIVIGTELTESTIEWANNLEHGLGISAAGLISDLKELTGILYGLGMSANDTSIASKNLITISNSLSTLTGYDTDTVINKITSGMKGMTQSVDDLGLSVREAEMDSFLKELKSLGGEYSNIANSFSALNEEQRVYVRYAALIKQYMDKYNIEAYTEGLNTITGRISQLKSAFNGLVSVIGTLMLKLLDKIIVPLTFLVNTVKKKIVELASFLGVDLSLSTDINGNDAFTKVSESANLAKENINGVADAVNSVNDATKKAKGSLDGFDHITSMSSSKSDSITSAITDSGFDYSSLMNMYDTDLAAMLEKIAKLNDDYYKSTEQKFYEMLNNMKSKFKSWFRDITRDEWSPRLNYEEIKAGIERIKNEFKRLGKNIRDIFGGLFFKILNDIKIGDITTKSINLLDKALYSINNILDVIKPRLLDLYNTSIKPLVEGFGVELSESIQEALDILEEFNKKLLAGDYEYSIAKIFGDVARYLKDIGKVGIIVKTLFTGQVSAKDNVALGINNNFVKVNDIATNIHTIFKNIVSMCGELLTSFTDWLSTDGLEDIKNIFKDIADTIVKNKDSIIEIVKSIASTQWAYIKTMLSIIQTAIQTIANNKDTVNSIMSSIQNIFNWIQNNPSLIEGVCEAALKLLDFIVGEPIISTLGLLAVNLGKVFVQFKAYSSLLSLGGASTVAGTAGTAAGGAGLAATAAPLIGVADMVIAPYAIYKGTVDVVDNMQQSVEVIKNGEFKHSWLAYESVMKGHDLSLGTDQIKEWAEVYANKFGTTITRDLYEQINASLRERLESEKDWSPEQLESHMQLFEGYLNSMVTIIDQQNQDTTASIENVQTSAQTLDEVISQFSNSTQESAQSLDDVLAHFDSSTNSANNSMNEVTSCTTKLRSGFSKLASEITNMASKIGAASNEIIRSVKTGSNMSISRVKSFRGFANGGTPRSGSLFMANENGTSELVGNFGGYTGVANQNMIIDSMQKAIGSSMYNAISSAMDKNNSGNAGNTYEICKGGIFVGDNASLRKLANMINTINMSSSCNIANINFNN